MLEQILEQMENLEQIIRQNLEQILKQIENTKLNTYGVHYSPSLFAQAIIILHADKMDYYVKRYIEHYSNKPQDQLIEALDVLIIDLMKKVMFRMY